MVLYQPIIHFDGLKYTGSDIGVGETNWGH